MFRKCILIDCSLSKRVVPLLVPLFSSMYPHSINSTPDDSRHDLIFCIQSFPKLKFTAIPPSRKVQSSNSTFLVFFSPRKIRSAISKSLSVVILKLLVCPSTIFILYPNLSINCVVPVTMLFSSSVKLSLAFFSNVILNPEGV